MKEDDIMPNEFEVVPLEQKYLKDVASLWSERFTDVVQRRKLFEWLTKGNPLSSRSSSYFLLLYQRKVIGMHGHMPLKFHVNGVEMMGYLGHDDMLSSNYRGKGLGKVLLEGAAKQASEFSGALWFNEANFRLYRKSGWMDVPGLYSYLKIFDPGSLIKRKVKNEIARKLVTLGGKVLLKAHETQIKVKLQEGGNIFQIEKFDEEFDNFFNIISSHFGFIVKRNEEYLNWKFVKKPFNNYRIFKAVDESEKLSGYVVLKSEKFGEDVHGKIVDILAYPEKPEVFRALIQKSIQEFVKTGASYIEIVCTYPRFIKLLKEDGFIKKPSSLKFMVNNWENLFDKEFIGNIKNWYLTLGDADGDAWTVDSVDAWKIRQ